MATVDIGGHHVEQHPNLYDAGNPLHVHDDAFFGLGSPFVEPCIMNVTQLIFVGLVYAYVLCKGSDMISDGSELLLLVPGVSEVGFFGLGSGLGDLNLIGGMEIYFVSFWDY